jgi:hypothetical protein
MFQSTDEGLEERILDILVFLEAGTPVYIYMERGRW